MAKLTLTDISSGFGSITTLNANFAAIETALENTLSRDGTSPNDMDADLDLNGHSLTNLTLTEYADDAAAAVGGLAVGKLYRTGSAVKVRVA